MHRASPLDFDVLVNRFRDEMIRYVVGNEGRIRLQFLELIELLFGDLKRVAAEKRI